MKTIRGLAQPLWIPDPSAAEYVKLKSCPRCGGDHEKLLKKPLARMPINGADGVAYTSYGTCSATGQPVLFNDPPETYALEA